MSEVKHRHFEIRSFVGSEGFGAHIITTADSPADHTGEKPEPGVIMKYIFGQRSRSRALQKAYAMAEEVSRTGSYYV